MENETKQLFFNEILTGLTALYTGAYLIDIREDKLYHVCRSVPNFEVFEEETKYSEYIRAFGEKAVHVKDVAEFFRQTDIDYLKKILNKGSERVYFEYRLRPKGETIRERWLCVNMAVVKRDDDGPSMIFCIINDVTDNKNHENFHSSGVVNTSDAELAVQKEINAKRSEYLTNISHEIRTPINGILGMLDIEERNMGDVEKQLDCHEKIRLASDHLLMLLNDVLDMNRIGNGDVEFVNEPINLSELVDECIIICTMQATERNVTIVRHRNIKVKHPYVLGSPLYIRQVLLNILNNAIKFNKEGGRIDVYLKEEESTADGVLMTFAVQDTGIGMSQMFLSNIYEPFSQASRDTREEYGGTGLGMSIVKAIVDGLKGFIDIKSQPGVGSRFTVTIPFVIDKNPVVKTTPESRDVANIAGLNILIVEDNDLNMEIAKFIIEDLGAHATLARNGREAVDAFKNSTPGTFDAILMDVMMPVMDGYQATREIRNMDRADAKAIPIIAMTAYAFDEDAKRCKNEGMNDHVAKPISPEIVARAIVKYAGRE